MPITREHIYSILNSKYRHIDNVNQDVCFYCGEPGDTIDHVPSLYQAYCVGLDEIERQNIQLYLIPSCRECNSLLGARPTTDPVDRRDDLKKLLQKRYKKFLNLPDWGIEELEELGPVMRKEVEDSMTIKTHIQRRLSWPD